MKAFDDNIDAIDDAACGFEPRKAQKKTIQKTQVEKSDLTLSAHTN